MRLLHVLTVPAMAVGLLAPMTAPAAAAETFRQPEVAWVNKNAVATADGGAQLLVKYRCWGEGVHLWGSVKQGPDLDPEQGHTSSDYAVSWRETADGDAPTCNGKWQVERITVGETGDTGSKADLTRGAGYFQFVIFAIDPDNYDEETGEGFGRGAAAGWLQVRGNA